MAQSKKGFFQSVEELENMALRRFQLQRDWEEDAIDPVERQMVTRDGSTEMGEEEETISLFVLNEDTRNEYKFKCRMNKSISDFKSEISTIIGIPKAYQEWKGFPRSTSDRCSFGSLSLPNEHHLMVLQKDSADEILVQKGNIENEESFESSSEDFEDALDNVGCNERESFKSTTNILFLDTDVDEVNGVVKFSSEFSKTFARKPVPSFYEGTLSRALRESAGLPLKTRKPLALYLHHSDSQFSHTFCAEKLCNVSVVGLLNRNFVIWGWDVTLESNRKTLLKLISQDVGVEAGNVIENIKVDKFPALIFIHKKDYNYSIHSIIFGDTNLANVLKHLNQKELIQSLQFNVENSEKTHPPEVVKKENDNWRNKVEKIESEDQFLNNSREESVKQEIQNPQFNVKNSEKTHSLEVVKKEKPIWRNKVEKVESKDQFLNYSKEESVKWETPELRNHRTKEETYQPRGWSGNGNRRRGRKNNNRGERGHWKKNRGGGRERENYRPREETYMLGRGSYQANRFSMPRRGVARYQNWAAQSENYYDSDSESVASDVSLGTFSSVSHRSSISPSTLVQTLIEFPNFETTLLTLLDTKGFNHKEVKRVAEESRGVFELEEETLRLRPKVKLCELHLGSDGCVDPKSCEDLHICDKYVNKNCDEEECIFGHTWRTNHNSEILKFFHLGAVPGIVISKYFRDFVFSHSKTSELGVCENYNNDGCGDEDCSKLHICIKYIDRNCVGNECKLNHKLFEKRVKKILEIHNVPVNESPRDILKVLRSSPLISKVIKEQTPSNEESNAAETLSVGKKTDENRTSEPNNREKSKTTKDVRTMWSHEFLGEVQVNEICYNSVEGYCDYEESGCWRLHSNYHFYWQIEAVMGKKVAWVNLTEDQVQGLEKAFCDPNVSKVELPVLEPQKSQKGLHLVLKGKRKWEADFDAMNITLCGEQVTMNLRRLCTEPTVKEVPKPCLFKWYFADKNRKWIEYGNVDSTGEENLKSNIDSTKIESQYNQNPDSVISFQNSSFAYSLDLKKMSQKNMTTGVRRPVRRRPVPHLKEDRNSGLPPDWEAMEPGQRYKRVVLQHSSTEYKTLETYIQSKGQTMNIVKIERIQNLYHFKAFKNKVEEMKERYKNDATVNIQRLFHGTNPDTVDKICEGNFDWRLHGSNAGQAYGRGTYFSPLPSTSYGYTRPDSNGQRFMFVAQVAVGEMALGNSSMVRPPTNAAYNIPYDSTANALVNPSIIVKYEMQEYYPEYILTLT